MNPHVVVNFFVNNKILMIQQFSFLTQIQQLRLCWNLLIGPLDKNTKFKLFFPIYFMSILNKYYYPFLISFSTDKSTIFKYLIEVRPVSHTTQKGRIRKFKVLLCIGKPLLWIGVGLGKHEFLTEAYNQAIFNAFKNIYSCKSMYWFLNYNKIFNITLKYKSSLIYLNRRYGNLYAFTRVPIWLDPIFQLLGLINISCKCYKSINKHVILNLLLSHVTNFK